MIYKNGKLVTQVQKDFIDLEGRIQKNISAIYKGTQLVWLTVYNAIRSCYGSGIWRTDKPWLDTDLWKNN